MAINKWHKDSCGNPVIMTNDVEIDKMLEGLDDDEIELVVRRFFGKKINYKPAEEL